MLTIAGLIIGLIVYWFRFALPQIKHDIRHRSAFGSGFKDYFVREFRRGIQLFAVVTPFVLVGLLLDWLFDTALVFN